MTFGRRTILPLAAVTLAALAFSGCVSKGPTAPSPVRRTLRVSGSGTCLPLLRILTAAYAERGDEVEFVYLPGLHSGGGIKGVAGGDLEVGAVSRDLTDEEKKLGLRYVKLSDDGLVLAAHPSVKGIDGLTSRQVRGIYSGEYTNWSQLGGDDLSITVLDRNPDESAKMILRQYVLEDTPVSPRAVPMFYESDMVEAIQTSGGAVGYFSLGYGLSSSTPLNVRYLKLDGIEASVANIESGEYAMVRPLGIVVGSSPSPELQRFVEWITGPEAKELMRQKGFAPALGAR